MKKYLMLGAVILGIVTTAFTVTPSKKENEKKQASLYWFVGTSYTGRQNTHANEVPLSGCPDAGSVHCEDGYDANDFNTTGDPTSGLKSGATINDFIRKQ